MQLRPEARSAPSHSGWEIRCLTRAALGLGLWLLVDFGLGYRKLALSFPAKVIFVVTVSVAAFGVVGGLLAAGLKL